MVVCFSRPIGKPGRLAVATVAIGALGAAAAYTRSKQRRLAASDGAESRPMRSKEEAISMISIQPLMLAEDLTLMHYLCKYEKLQRSFDEKIEAKKKELEDLQAIHAATIAEKDAAVVAREQAERLIEALYKQRERVGEWTAGLRADHTLTSTVNHMRVTTLWERVEELQQQLRVAQQERDAAVTAKETLEAQAKALEKEKAQALANYNDQSSIIALMRQEGSERATALTSKAAEAKYFQRRVERLESEMDQLRRQLAEKETQERELREEKDAAAIKITDLTHELQSTRDEASKYQKLYEEAKSVNEATQAQLVAKEQEFAQQGESLKIAQEEAGTYKRLLHDSAVAEEELRSQLAAREHENAEQAKQLQDALKLILQLQRNKEADQVQPVSAGASIATAQQPPSSAADAARASLMASSTPQQTTPPAAGADPHSPVLPSQQQQQQQTPDLPRPAASSASQAAPQLDKPLDRLLNRAVQQLSNQPTPPRVHKPLPLPDNQHQQQGLQKPQQLSLSKEQPQAHLVAGPSNLGNPTQFRFVKTTSPGASAASTSAGLNGSSGVTGNGQHTDTSEEQFVFTLDEKYLKHLVGEKQKNLNDIYQRSSAKVTVDKKTSPPTVTIKGSANQITHAKTLISDRLNWALKWAAPGADSAQQSGSEAGSGGQRFKAPSTSNSIGSDATDVEDLWSVVWKEKVLADGRFCASADIDLLVCGVLIGAKGATIDHLKKATNATVSLQNDTGYLTIKGEPSDVQTIKTEVEKLLRKGRQCDATRRKKAERALQSGVNTSPNANTSLQAEGAPKKTTSTQDWRSGKNPRY